MSYKVKVVFLFFLFISSAYGFTDQICELLKGDKVLQSKTIKITPKDVAPCSVIMEQTFGAKKIKYTRFKSPTEYMACENAANQEILNAYKKGFVCGNI